MGCGKSTILTYLAQREDTEILQADLLAKELERRGGPCYEPLLQLFGRKILDAEGEISAPLLAKCLFSDEERLKQANAVIHPKVEEEIRRRLERCTKRFFFLEAALLLERGYDKILDEVWYVYASPEVRAKRLRESRGYDEERIRGIMASQLSDAEFRAKCTRVIDNEGAPEEALKQVEKILGSWFT